MKASTIPVICGLSLAAMSAAGFAHWWTVDQMIATIDTTILQPASEHSIPSVPKQEPTPSAMPAEKISRPVPTLAAEPDSSQKEFYVALLAEMKKLRTENRDLLDQMAETNRDVMNLQFRVDTHSKEFRPLPVSEERPDTTSLEDIGVLPPRAQPVSLPSGQ